MHIFIIGGAIKSFGVLYVEFMERFETSAEAAAWILVFTQSSTLYLGKRQIIKYFLPTTCMVRAKVMFSHSSVILFGEGARGSGGPSMIEGWVRVPRNVNGRMSC